MALKIVFLRPSIFQVARSIGLSPTVTQDMLHPSEAINWMFFEFFLVKTLRDQDFLLVLQKAVDEPF